MAVMLKRAWGGLLLMMPGSAFAPDQSNEVDTMLATDQAWLESKINGDVQKISDLLLPGYVTVDFEGTDKTRDQLIGAARGLAGRSIPTTALRRISWQRRRTSWKAA